MTTAPATPRKVRVADRWEAAYLQAKGLVSSETYDEQTRRTVFEFDGERPRREIVGQDALNLLHAGIERISDEALKSKALASFAVLEQDLKSLPPIEMTVRDDLGDYDRGGLVQAKAYKLACQSCANRIRERNNSGGLRK